MFQNPTLVKWIVTDEAGICALRGCGGVAVTTPSVTSDLVLITQLPLPLTTTPSVPSSPLNLFVNLTTIYKLSS